MSTIQSRTRQSSRAVSRPSVAQECVLELLSEIFLLCLPDNLLPHMRQTEAPLSVSHVCRTWRNAALLTRSLWAGAHVVCDNDDTTLDFVLPALTEWLQRSGNADLSIRVECPPAMIAGSVDTARRSSSWVSVQVVLLEAMRHRKRLKFLSIFMPCNFFSDVSRLIQKECHSLKCLDARFDDGYWGQVVDLDVFSDIFSRLTELSFSLGSVNRVQTTLHAFPQCSNLRKLNLGLSVSERFFVTVLKNCPSVEELSLSLLGLYSATAAPLFQGTGRTTVKSLRILSLRVTDSRFIGEVLNATQMPSLSDLTLDLGGDEFLVVQPLPNWHLLDFLTRSNPPLESLYLRRAPMTPLQIVQCLKLLPRLRRLRACVTETVARALTLPAHAPQAPDVGSLVCPVLEEFTIALLPLDFKDALVLWSAAEDMIRSRWPFARDGKASASTSKVSGQVPKTLRRVNIPSMDVKRHPLFKGIKDCIRQGFILDSEE